LIQHKEIIMLYRAPALLILILLALLLSSCTSGPTPPAPTATPPPTALPAATAPPVEQPIYLAIIWHQHQPVYFREPSTGVYAKPWVRVHATKDYVDMATTVARYPKVKVTFNITPSLIRQLDDLAAGAKDLYRCWPRSQPTS
jgi:hypothetical protein